MKREERERLERLIAERTDPRKTDIQDEDSGVDYAEEYRKQTGKGLSAGVSSDKYVVQ